MTGKLTQKQVLYTGPAAPTAWDPNWDKFTNLTPAQRGVFEAMPEDLINYATISVQQADVKSLTHSSGIVVQPTLNGAAVTFKLPGKDIHQVDQGNLLDAHQAYVARWSKLQTALTSIGSDVTAKKVTSRAQIDAALKAASTV
jgi:hypothetical protein